MNIEQIDRYCDLYEQRLKEGQRITIEQFLEEHQLPRDDRLLEELLRLDRSYVAREGLGAGDQSDAQTIDMKGSPRQPSVQETTVVPPESLAATQRWSIDRTLALAAEKPRLSITTSLKAHLSADSQSQTNLVIQQRIMRQPDRAAHQPADYDLINLLGKGGMGIVYAARQGSLDRTVAVKMLKPETAADQAASNEFLSEACVTGDLEHPNIVPIYDLGRNAEGAFFYAMKCVQGTPWKDVIRDKPLLENIEILMKVCDAVAFGHSKGVVHRDLKPENVMLGDFGEVLVMDWGLAVATDINRRIGGIKKMPTMGGTPAYMAPEMASGPFQRIGPASDVYLLGAILYEITTGLRAHTGKNVQECLYAASRNVIQRTDKRDELIDIALHAMEYKPEDRYPSVQAFQNAIRQYQSHSESIALSTRAAENLSRARQSNDYEDYNRALFGFQQAIELWDGNEKAVSGLAETRLAYATCAKAKGDYDLGAGLLDVSIAEHASLHAEITAAQKERDARQQRLRTYKRIGAAMAIVLFSVVTGAAILIELERAETERQREAAVDARAAEQEQRIIAEKNFKEAEKQKKSAVANMQLAIANEQEATRQRDEAERQRELAEESERQAIVAKRREAYEAYVARIGAAVSRIEENAYDSARQLLAQCIPQNPDEDDHRNWEWGRLWYLCQQASRTFPAADLPLESLALVAGPDGGIEKFAAGGAGGRAQVWSADGAKLADIDADADYIHALAFSPDGQQIAVASSSDGGFVKIFDARTGALQATLDDPAGQGHTKPVLSVEYSRDGRRLLTGSRDGTAKVWDAQNGRLLTTLHRHRWWVWQARFLPERDAAQPERNIVTASQDGTAVVWSDDTGQWQDAASTEKSPPFRQHQGPIYAVAVSPDGQTIATAGHDKRVLIWRADDVRAFDFDQALSTPIDEPIAAPTKYRELIGHTAAVRGLAFSQDGGLLVSGGHDNTVRVWGVESGRSLKTLRGHGEWVRSCAVSPGGREVLSASFDATVRLWDIDGYEEVRVLRGKLLEGHEDAVLAAAFSADTEKIVTASRDRLIKTWDFHSGDELQSFREGHSFLASNAVFFHDGRRLATAAVDNTVRIWEVESGRQLHVLRGTGRSAVVAVSPDAKQILTAGPIAEQQGNTRPIWLARLWDADSGQLIQDLKGHTAQVTAVAFSASGEFCYTGDLTGLGILWDTKTGAKLRELTWHRAKVIGAVFLDDDRSLVTASIERAVARWDFREGEVDESGILLHSASLVSMDADPSGRFVVTSCEDNAVRLWDLRTGGMINSFPGRDGAPTGAVVKVAISRDARYVLALDSDQRSLRIYDVATGLEIRFPQTRLAQGPFLQLPARWQLWSAAFSPEGRHVITLGGDQAQLWELDEDQLPLRRLRMNFSPHGVVASAGFSTDGAKIVSGSWDGSANIWDAASGQSRLKLVGMHAGRVNSAVFSPDRDSRLVLTASDDGTAVLWDAVNGDFIRRFVPQAGALLCAAFSSDAQRVLTSADDGSLQVWDLNNGREPIPFPKEHHGPVLHAAFSRDGTRVVSGGADNLAKIWNLSTQEVERTLAGHTAPVTSVAFTPDGRRVLTGSEDFTAKLWDARTGVELLTLKGHEQEVTSVALSTDGQYVLTGSQDATAIVWLAAPWDNEATGTTSQVNP